MFVGDLNKKEAAFLRSNDTIELYSLIPGNKLAYITKYQITNGKCLEMQALRLTWKTKDILVLYIPQDKVNVIDD